MSIVPPYSRNCPVPNQESPRYRGSRSCWDPCQTFLDPTEVWVLHPSERRLLSGARDRRLGCTQELSGYITRPEISGLSVMTTPLHGNGGNSVAFDDTSSSKSATASLLRTTNVMNPLSRRQRPGTSASLNTGNEIELEEKRDGKQVGPARMRKASQALMMRKRSTFMSLHQATIAAETKVTFLHKTCEALHPIAFCADD